MEKKKVKVKGHEEAQPDYETGSCVLVLLLTKPSVFAQK